MDGGTLVDRSSPACGQCGGAGGNVAPGGGGAVRRRGEHGDRLVARFRATGSVAPGQMGGHRPKKLSGAWREWLLERCRTDFTLRGLVAELGGRGMPVDYKTVWEFVHAEKLTHKKRR